MDDHIYKVIHLTGSSSTSSDDAVRQAIARAGKTVRHMRWFAVEEIRGALENGEIASWQVSVKIGFRLEDEADAG
ncbi:MAG: dodecin [Litorilinea sp.]